MKSAPLKQAAIARASLENQKFLFNGKLFTRKEIDKARGNTDFDTYLSKHNIKLSSTPEITSGENEDGLISNILNNANFQNDPADAETNVGSNQSDTVSDLAVSLSEYKSKLDTKRDKKRTEEFGVKVDNTRVNIPKFDKVLLKPEDNPGTSNYLKGLKALYTDPTRLDYGIPKEEVEELISQGEDGINKLLQMKNIDGVSVVDQYNDKVKTIDEVIKIDRQRYLVDSKKAEMLNDPPNKEKKVDFLLEPFEPTINEDGSENYGFRNNIFSQDEEEGEKNLEQMFEGTNIQVEQASVDDIPEEDYKRMESENPNIGGFEFIKVTIPGAEDSVVLEFNTDFAGNVFGEKANKLNYDMLKAYMLENSDLISTNADVFSNREKKAEIARAITNEATESNLNYIEEKKTIGEKYNRKNLEDANSETSKLFSGTTVAMPTNALDGMDVQGEKEMFVKGVLSDQYKQAYKELSDLSEEVLEKQFKVYGVKSVEELAKVVVLNQNEVSEINALKSKYTQIYIEDAEVFSYGSKDKRRELAAIYNVGSRFEEVKLTKEQQEIELKQDIILDTTKNNAEIGKIIKQVVDQKGIITPEQEETLTKALNNMGILINPLENTVRTQTNIDENGVETTEIYNEAILKNLQALYDNVYITNEANYKLFNDLNEESQDIADKQGDLSIAMNTASRNYDRSEKYISNVTLGTTDIFMGIGNLGYNIIMLGTQMDEDSVFQSYYEGSNRIRNSYVRDIDFSSKEGGAFSPSKGYLGLGNFGAFLMQEATNQLPILAAMVASGGYAAVVVGASSTGQKQMDMTYQIMNGMEDYSHANMWFTSLGYGIAEGGFAHLTTVPILNRAKKTLLRGNKLKGFQAMETGQKQWLKENSKGTVTDILLEPLGEIGTVGAQNMFDGNDITMGMDHAGFSGLGFGILFSGIPFLRGAYNSKFSSYENQSEMRTLRGEIDAMSSKLDMLRKTGGSFLTRDQLIENIKIKQDKLNSLIESDTQLIENTLGAEAIGMTIETRNKQLELQNKINAVNANTDLDQATKIKLIKEYAAEFDRRNAILDTALSNDNKKKLRTEFELLNDADTDRYNDYLTKAEQELNSLDPNKDYSADKIRNKGYELFMRDKFEESDSQAGAEGVEIEMFETVDEAVVHVQGLIENGTVSEADGELMIQGFKQGNDGAAVKGTDVTISIMENRLKNEQQYVKHHEIGHQVFWKIFNGEIGFEDVSSQLLESMSNIDNKVYQDFINDQRIYDNNGNVDSKEVISVFLEYIAADRFGTKKSKGLAGLFGVLTEVKLKDKYKFDFKGADDYFSFAVELGKKINNGTLTKEDISDASQSQVVIDAKSNDIINNSRQAPSNIANSASTNLEGMLNDYVSGRMNNDRSKKGLPKLPPDYTPKPEKKREKIRGFVNDMLRYDVNGNFVNNIMDSKLVTESDAMGPYITTISNRIWNGLDPMNREGQTLETWKELVAMELSTMIQQEYLKPNKDGVTKYQDLDKFVRNRGYFRVFSLAEETFKQTPASLGLETVADVTNENNETQAEEVSVVPGRKNFGDKVKFISDGKAITIPNILIDRIKDNIVKTFRLGNFKNKVGTNKFRTELAKKYSNSIGLIFRKLMQRGENFNNDVKLSREQVRGNISEFLSANFDNVYDLPVDVLTKKYPFLTQSTGVRMNAEQIRNHNDAVDKGLIVAKKITDIKSGPFIFEKVKDKKKAKIDFLNYFEGNNVAPNTRGARQLSLADTFAQEAGFDVQAEVLMEAGFKTEAFIQDLSKNVGRVAFSAVNKLTVDKQKVFYASIPGVASQLNPSSTNWGSEDSVLNTFKSLLSANLPDSFTKKEINAIAKDLTSYAKRFDLVDPLVKNDTGALTMFLETMTSEGQVNQALKEYLGLKDNISEGFNSKERIERHRALPLDYIKQFEPGTPEFEQAVIDIVINGPMYKGATLIGNGKFTIEDGNVVENKEASRKGTHRYQVFLNTSDFYNHLNTIPGVDIDIKLTRQKKLPWLKINGKEISTNDVTLIPETSKSGLSDRDFEGRLEQAKNARRFVKNMMEMVVDGDYDNMDLAMLMKQMDSQMTAPLKRAANLEYVVEGLKAADARYEHMMPTNYVLMNLVDYYKNNRSEAGNLSDKLFEEYKVAIIPKNMDNFLTKVGLQSKMNLGYKVGDPVWKRYYNIRTWGNPNFVAIKSINPDANGEIIGEAWETAGKAVNKPELFKKLQQLRAETKAISLASTVAFSKKPKGISVWDFDDTLAQTKSNVLYTLPDGTKGKIDATQFALQSADLEAIGAKFDFSEFSKVMKGKRGPMFDKAVKRNNKFGNENVFILTARPQNAAPAIHTFLKGIGLDIRLDNIVGLEDGTAKAKADWMITKIADGYNDFYFADDAIKNVKAVKEVYDSFDVKGKVQQAKVAFSQSLSDDFNKMIERQKGVDANKRFSEVVARRRGKKSGRFKFFVPPSAEDFRGLTQYIFAGKGKQGEADQKFFEDSLMTPYFKGVAAIESARQAIKRDTKALLKMYKPVVKKLGKLIPDGDFTFDSAIRVYLWTEAGVEIPGISKRDQKKLHNLVKNDSDLSGYADGLLSVSKAETWPEPGQYWDTQTTLSDLQNLTDKVNRKEYLSEFIENVDIIFSKENLFKIEALYGKSTRSAIEDSIYAMKTGSNRTRGGNSINNAWLNWINNSVGTIMFFNRRSALLQTISSTNFINWGDNNILKAGLAFANQKQYWKDFAMIFNSDKLKQRRSGLKSDVQEAEIANAAKNTQDKANAVISYLLKIGFTPTQIADSFAIAAGGASFYRNRVNTYIKKGMSKAEAEAAAFQDFSKVSDEAQQSGDPALVSQQQRSTAGRLILAFQNTPMQYTRLMKKAGQDIINGRGDFKTNFSKIIYYGAVQNLIFNALQNALFALIPGFDDDEIEDEKLELNQSQKQARILNGMMDSIIRGSGIYGAVATTIKNTYLKYLQQEKKGYNADHAYTLIEAANISPPIGSKFRKIYSAIQTKKFDKDVINKHPWDVTINGKYNPSPNYEIIGSLSSAILNLPLDRALIEAKGIAEALDSRNTTMQRLALALGWRTWGVGVENEEFDEIKAEAKEKRKEEGIIKAKKTREENKLKELLRYNNLSPEERAAEDAEKARKRSEAAKKGAETRKRNKRIKDSIQTADLIKLLQQ